MSEIVVNISTRSNGGRPAKTIETIIIREINVKDAEEIADEIRESLEDIINLALDELGLLENE